MARDIAIVLNSGGLNSAVVSALAAQRYRPIFLHGEAPTAAGVRLRAAYEQQVGHFKPFREHTLPLPVFGTGAGGTASQQAMNDPRQEGGRGLQLLELLSLIGAAARLAAQHQAAAIYLGLNVGPGGDELAQASEFVQVWNELIQLPCRQPDIEVMTPLLELESWQIVDVGFQVSAPLEKTWSCTSEGSEPCWACRGCRNREAAFAQAAKTDPLRAMKRI
jgi:7-cyano-7-deazaguanine synthase